jgi:hypothetical protein
LELTHAADASTLILKGFGTGVLQVFLVALQTRQIAHRSKLWLIFLVALAISGVWIFNVRAAVGSLAQGVSYVIGAGVGTVAAMKIRFKEPAQNQSTTQTLHSQGVPE